MIAVHVAAPSFVIWPPVTKTTCNEWHPAPFLPTQKTESSLSSIGFPSARLPQTAVLSCCQQAFGVAVQVDMFRMAALYVLERMESQLLGQLYTVLAHYRSAKVHHCIQQSALHDVKPFCNRSARSGACMRGVLVLLRLKSWQGWQIWSLVTLHVRTTSCFLCPFLPYLLTVYTSTSRRGLCRS